MIYKTQENVKDFLVKKLLKVRRLFIDNAAIFTLTSRIFFHNDAQNSTLTTSRCFFDDIVH